MALVVGVVSVRADSYTSNHINGTCDIGYQSVSCEKNCVTMCEFGYKFQISSYNCEDPFNTTYCNQCQAGMWCDGSSERHVCVEGMTSPVGSTDEGNCICHGGHIANEGMCIACPEGSWCDINGQHSCPNGTTSNLRSRSQEDCYCLDANTTDVNCSARINTTHRLCDAGYADTSSPSSTNSSCQMCSSGYWCDGTDYFRCPEDRVAAFANYGAASIDDCLCPHGFIAESFGSKVCVACPERSLSNVLTRGYFDPNCIPSTIAVVTTTPTTAVVTTTPTAAVVTTTPTATVVTTTMIILIGGGGGGVVVVGFILILMWACSGSTSIRVVPPSTHNFFQGVKMQMPTGVDETLYGRI
jgi:hypothetical protein